MNSLVLAAGAWCSLAEQEGGLGEEEPVRFLSFLCVGVGGWGVVNALLAQVLLFGYRSGPRSLQRKASTSQAKKDLRRKRWPAQAVHLCFALA